MRGLNGFAARIERLEGLWSKLPLRVHRVIVDGESRESALKRYEQEAGLEIGPDDLVMLLTIVDPAES